MPKEVWTGLVAVTPKRGSKTLNNAGGAYVNVLAWAEDVTQYRKLVQEALKKRKLDVEKFENAGPLANYDVTKRPKMLRLAKEVRKSRSVRFGTFHLFPKESSGHKRK